MILKALRGVTITTSVFDDSVEAYARLLGYRGAAAPLDEARAARFGALEATGARTARLYPESGERFFVELIETAVAPPDDYRPLTTWGWNAAEIVVADLDALATRLAADDFFRIIGPPATLDFDFTDAIRAMQVAGPNGEVLYLTEIGAEVPGFSLPRALSPVGRLFVAILGVPSLESAAAAFEADGLGTFGPAFQARIEVLSAAAGLDPAMRHDLATVALAEDSLIEIDRFPESTRSRRPLACGLMPGLASVTFEADVAEPWVRTVSGALFECMPE